MSFASIYKHFPQIQPDISGIFLNLGSPLEFKMKGLAHKLLLNGPSTSSCLLGSLTPAITSGFGVINGKGYGIHSRVKWLCSSTSHRYLLAPALIKKDSLIFTPFLVWCYDARWSLGHWCVNSFPFVSVQELLEHRSVLAKFERETEVKEIRK